MTGGTITPQSTRSKLVSYLITGILAVPPLAKLAKRQARSMMINRAEAMGVPWRQTVQALRTRDVKPSDHVVQSGTNPAVATMNTVASVWEAERTQIQSSNLIYPDYYLTSFHAYDEGNMGWIPAMEVEMAALAVHARIWPDAGIEGDARLRQSYHEVLNAQVPDTLTEIVDLGCGVGMSTVSLRSIFPRARCTGVDLSPYFLAIAQYREQRDGLQSRANPIQWVHAAAENTHLPAQCYDLVSACLVFHELPQYAARNILAEARRLLRPGGYVALMDMNPECDTFAKMPPFVFTLLKSTEPYLDEYLSLDLEQAIYDAGFHYPQVTVNSPRHRTLVAHVR